MSRTQSTKTVLRTPWFSVERQSLNHLKALDGKPHYRIRCADGVVMFAMTHRGEIVIVRQFRPALMDVTIELPCGHVEKTESPRMAARRELHEETGYVCRKLVYLGAGRTKMDRIANREHGFLGTGAALDPKFVAKEDIEVILATPEQLARWVRSGRFQQWSALSLFLLAEWKTGLRLLGDSASIGLPRG